MTGKEFFECRFEQLVTKCSDLVSLKKYEPVLLELLTKKRGAEWSPVQQVCAMVGLANEIPMAVSVCWLPVPIAKEGYVLIVFYDQDSGWSMTANYNKSRLIENCSGIAISC